MVDRVVGGGSLQDGGQDRGLGKRDVARRLAEVFLGGLLDANGAGTVVDAIEVELEDVLLGELGLEPDGEHHLLELALYGPLRLQEQVLGQLLGQGGPAFDDVPGAIVRDGGASEADRIDAEVAVEATVLDGDHRLRHVDRKLVQPHLVAEERAAFGQHLAVGGEHDHAGLAVGNLEQALLVEGEPHICGEAAQGDEAPQAQHEAPGEKPIDDGAAARRPAGRPAGVSVEPRFPATVALPLFASPENTHLISEA